MLSSFLLESSHILSTYHVAGTWLIPNPDNYGDSYSIKRKPKCRRKAINLPNLTLTVKDGAEVGPGSSVSLVLFPCLGERTWENSNKASQSGLWFGAITKKLPRTRKRPIYFSNFAHSSTISTSPGWTGSREGPHMAILTRVRVPDGPGIDGFKEKAIHMRPGAARLQEWASQNELVIQSWNSDWGSRVYLASLSLDLSISPAMLSQGTWTMHLRQVSLIQEGCSSLYTGPVAAWSPHLLDKDQIGGLTKQRAHAWEAELWRQ